MNIEHNEYTPQQIENLRQHFSVVHHSRDDGSYFGEYQDELDHVRGLERRYGVTILSPHYRDRKGAAKPAAPGTRGY